MPKGLDRSVTRRWADSNEPKTLGGRREKKEKDKREINNLKSVRVIL